MPPATGRSISPFSLTRSLADSSGVSNTSTASRSPAKIRSAGGAVSTAFCCPNANGAIASSPRASGANTAARRHFLKLGLGMFVLRGITEVVGVSVGNVGIHIFGFEGDAVHDHPQNMRFGSSLHVECAEHCLAAGSTGKHYH